MIENLSMAPSTAKPHYPNLPILSRRSILRSTAVALTGSFGPIGLGACSSQDGEGTLSEVPFPASPTEVPPQSPAAPELLMTFRYTESATDPTAGTGWVAEQEPSGLSGEAFERISIVGATALAENLRQDGYSDGVLKVELKPFQASDGSRGDVFTIDGRESNRSEVYGRTPAFMSSTPPLQWPDPVGSIRWYQMGYFFPTNFAFSTPSDWLVVTQWKGQFGGMPPLAVEVVGDRLTLGGDRGHSGVLPNEGDLGAIVRETWTTLLVGICWSTIATEGWVEVYRDGGLVLPRTNVATMDYRDKDSNTGVDPIYFKQGLYRAESWKLDHLLYLAPPSIMGGTA